MNYLKLNVTIAPFKEWMRDVLTMQLTKTGFESFMETDSGFEGYIPEKEFNKEEVVHLFNAFGENCTIEFQQELIEEKNWNEEWEKNYFEPLSIGRECVIRAPFHKNFPKVKFEIIIEPNMAFGTGHHETTLLMLEAILANDMLDKTILDMGCGTGILGILASMKGAQKITAIDIDEWSYKGAFENAQINNIQNMVVKMGDALLLRDEKYDIIFANIHKNVLMQDLPVYSKSLNIKGKLFMSGFYMDDLHEIQKSATESQLTLIDHKKKNNWVMSVFQKKTKD